MKYEAINYFPNLDPQEIDGLAKVIQDSGMDIAYAGKSQIPKKWSGDLVALSKMLSEKDGVEDFTVIENAAGDLRLCIDLYELPQCPYSTIRISGSEEKTVELLCMYFKEKLSSYACVSTEMGSGVFNTIYISRNCPDLLKQTI